MLAVAKFVTGEEHGHALGKQQRGEKVSFLTCTQSQNGFVAGLSFGTTIPTVVLIASVAIFLAVGIIVFGVVADEIVQGKTIVATDEVEAGARPTSGMAIEIAVAGQAGGKLTHGAAPALPETPEQAWLSQAP